MAFMQRPWSTLKGLVHHIWPCRKTGDPSAELRNWRSELIFLTNEEERGSLDRLIEGALADTDADKQRTTADYVRKRLIIAIGGDQVFYPVLGIFVSSILPLLLLLLLGLLVDNFALLGLTFEVFMWIIIAGATGGVLRVVRRSVRREHQARSKLMFFFVGAVHPLTGVVLGVAATLAFRSGFINLPVPSPNESITIAGSAHSWTQEEFFLVLASFAAGFTEDWIAPVLRRLGSGPRR